MYRGWTEIEYQNKHYDIDQKDEGTLDDRRRDGGTNSTLRIKEQGTHLTLNEHDDDDDDDDNVDDDDLSLFSDYRSSSSLQTRNLCLLTENRTDRLSYVKSDKYRKNVNRLSSASWSHQKHAGFAVRLTCNSGLVITIFFLTKS